MDELIALFADLVNCRDCGHDFSPDSSPHPDRCWECAEIADAGSGR